MATVAIRENPEKMSSTLVIVGWVLRLIAAVILLQTLFFKFSGAPESVYIFGKLSSFLAGLAGPIFGAKASAAIVGSEAYSRIGSGIVELVAAVLLIYPRFPWAGALLALAATGGAVFSHLTFLGIDVQGDHGLLFGLAIVTVLCSIGVIVLYREQLPIVGDRFQ
jgi:hypothetical protein